jgi:hypothetical protein
VAVVEAAAAALARVEQQQVAPEVLELLSSAM